MSNLKEMRKKKDVTWYAIHTYSGYENKVRSHLEARIASMDMRNKIFHGIVAPVEERGGDQTRPAAHGTA